MDSQEDLIRRVRTLEGRGIESRAEALRLADRVAALEGRADTQSELRQFDLRRVEALEGGVEEDFYEQHFAQSRFLAKMHDRLKALEGKAHEHDHTFTPVDPDELRAEDRRRRYLESGA